MSGGGWIGTRGQSAEGQVEGIKKKVGKTAGRKLRRIGSLNHLGERKLDARPIIRPLVSPLCLGGKVAQQQRQHVLLFAYRTRVCTRTRSLRVVRTSGEDDAAKRADGRMRAPVFSLIANRPVFSIFKDALVCPSYLLFIDYLARACPPASPAQPARLCLHSEEVEQPASANALISSLSVRALYAPRYCKLSFLTKPATGILRYLRLTGT